MKRYFREFASWLSTNVCNNSQKTFKNEILDNYLFTLEVAVH